MTLPPGLKVFVPPGVEVLTWHGAPARPLQLWRPCACGCDTRDGRHIGWAGYLSWSNRNGDGITIWVRSEAVFRELRRRLPELT